jgi:hypothetical protein
MTLAPETGPGHDITIDAYTGAAPVSGRFADDIRGWALAGPPTGEGFLPPHPTDPANWRDKRIGWGVVLAETPGFTAAQLTALEDVPEDLKRLIDDRAGKVLRYRAGATFSDWTLRDYAGGGDVFTAGAKMGMGPKEMPGYLLIYGSPTAVPWHIQFQLHSVRHVGRIDLEGEALRNYVDALLTEWADSAASYADPVVWAVDHRAGEITTLMRDVVAEPLNRAFVDGGEHPTFIDGSVTEATVAALTQALVSQHPAFVVTSSHGMTGPLDDLDAMRASMGLPVDQAHAVLDPDALLAQWQPDGAIWFAQACCSAGAESPSTYEGLFQPKGQLDKVMSGVAAAGAMISPLPRALLGAKKPLRAFIGHVEPTFNWTLQFPPNRQQLTADLTKCLYDGVYGGLPVGLAMDGYYDPVGSLLQGYLRALRKYRTTVGTAAKPSLDMLVYSRVTAHDRSSTVILGDPTVAVPLPAPPP